MKKMMGVLLVLCLFGSSGVSAQELTVDEIVQKANLASYYSGQDGSADVTMTITDSRGRVRERQFRILRYDLQDGAEQKFYVYFKKPADVSKMVYMVWKQIGRDDDRWLYLPALDLVRRIASSDKRSSFVGSHFVYEDVSGRGIDLDEHVLLETTAEHYKIKNTPKDANEAEFSYYDVTIRKDNFLPVKAEYYGKDGKLMRVIEAQQFEDINGIPTVIRSQAKDLVRGGNTVMEFSDVRYDVGLSDDFFAERYLRRPPLQWIK